MIKFWKKSGQKEQNVANSPPPPPPTQLQHSPSGKLAACEIVRGACDAFDPDKSDGSAALDDEGLCDISETDNPKKRSRLSKTFTELLSDRTALGYFVQYMKSHETAAYIHCWLDVANFQRSLLSQSTAGNSKTEHDSLSISTDCDDSYTADSNSLCDFDKSSADAAGESRTEMGPVCEGGATPINGTEEPKASQNAVDAALKIFKRYIALEATESVKCPEGVRKEVIENICNADKVLNANCFDTVQSYLLELMERDHFGSFLASDYYCKNQIDVLTSGNIVLEDILCNETALFYFMEFLEQENNSSLLEFWLAATNFHQQLRIQGEFFDPLEAQSDAVVLYDKYFSLQAHCPLGFNDKVRFAVEQNICGENGLIMECFRLPLKIIEHVLEKHYLKPFLASQLFYKYLSELINTVQTNGYTNGIEKGRRAPSDCSSESFSFSTKSTFLAMENPSSGGGQRRSKSSSDMSIDTRQLYDPDSLWKRKKNNRLSFGRITELGRFETDFEPEPDKNRPSLKSVVRKFVSLEEDKRKEEMAWQVAEMIVKDITSVTLSDGKPFQS